MSNSIKFEYTNWKRIRSKRNIIPIKLVFESNQYHGNNKNLWLLIAFDIDKQGIRSFAVEDIHFPIYVHRCWVAQNPLKDRAWNYNLQFFLELLNRLPCSFDISKYKMKENISIVNVKNNRGAV